LEEKRVALKLELNKDLPALIMDVGNMKRVILQLVANALEAMALGGELTLKTCVKDGLVELQVMDNGRGIPENMLPHIFDTFIPPSRPAWAWDFPSCTASSANTTAKSGLTAG
jgi:signal transduction histidine kinase